MSKGKKNLIFCGVLTSCIVSVLAFLLVTSYGAASIQGDETTYELRPEIWAPEYRTDTARAIDAYERLMERYMDLSERNYSRIGDNVENVIEKLDSLDKRLAQLSERIARIEKALDIEQPESIGEISTFGGQNEKDNSSEHHESEKKQ